MVRLYHNPRCSKSRAALQILEQQGVAFTIFEYLKTPPTEAELRALIAKLDVPAKDLVRRGESAYRESGLADVADVAEPGDQAIIDALRAHPILLQRPILETETQAVIGRPPERIREVLA